MSWIIDCTTRSPRLTGLTFTCVPVATVVSKFYGEYYRKKTKQTMDSLAAAGTVADESLSALSTIRSFAAEELMMDLVAPAAAQRQRKMVSSSLAFSFWSALSFTWGGLVGPHRCGGPGEVSV